MVYEVTLTASARGLHFYVWRSVDRLHTDLDGYPGASSRHAYPLDRWFSSNDSGLAGTGAIGNPYEGPMVISYLARGLNDVITENLPTLLSPPIATDAQQALIELADFVYLLKLHIVLPK